ncbi:ABC transporter substrate-binding protein [Microbacterium sp. 4R-513]|uniref:ABC transporter substrate-binding protein n=1 Tax=Microbacterium sp. 4R-513 TaxID=2567934 RepID=UPI0013E198F1|nr:ABC transporter substrate-binding protein [Microbacterium sp. 4R-513]QIG39495.1 ABC transporter substrate-binding protein [Microbacterium sp. 4R-513]
MNYSRTHARTAGALAVVSVAATLLLTGCSGAASGEEAPAAAGEPVAGGTLTVARGNLFEGFELDQETLNSSFQLSQAVLEPLIRTNAEGTDLEPGIASEWTYNDDNTQLTIALNPEATFSDGEPVTADDVAFSVQTWQDGPNYGAVYGGIEGTEVIDDHTIRFDLANPDTSLPAFLSWANAGVIPADFGGRSAEEFWQEPIGAGPFTVESWSSTGDIVLAKNPHYYKEGQPYLDKVVSSYAADSNSLSLQLKSKQIDVADEISPVLARGLDQSLVLPVAEHNTPLLLMNTADPALSDPAVRQAIGYALDYPAILKSVYSGYGSAPTGALPTNLANWAAPSSPYFSQDLEKAKSLLKGKDVPETLDFIFTSQGSATLLAQIVADNLAEIGITVNLVPQDAGARYTNLTNGDYQLASFAYNAISPDVSDPISYVTATDGMFTGFTSPEVDEQVAAYQQTADPEEKKAAITALQDIYSEQAPFIALGHLPSLGAAQKTVRDIQLTLWGTYALETIWKSE